MIKLHLGVDLFFSMPYTSIRVGDWNLRFGHQPTGFMKGNIMNINFENEFGDVVTSAVESITPEIIQSELERVNREYSFMGPFTHQDK